MLAVVESGALLGVEALPVQVEVNTGEGGEPGFFMVGLPDKAVKESIDRMLAALHNSGFRSPGTRTTINLAPGDIRKEGPLYDLPIALGILASTGQLERERLEGFLVAGELGLSGELRPVKGGLALAMLAKREGLRGIILPPKSADDAAFVGGIPVYAAACLDDAVAMLEGRKELVPVESAFSLGQGGAPEYLVDYSEVKGQHNVRRAVEVAVAGQHNLLVIGPPGSGKSMVAKRIPTIMPEPSLDEYLEILNIASAAGVTLREGAPRPQRPFRSPHHTISDVGLLGGGSVPGPGEISLAHHGVLFLDELPEFKRSALEVMRQPLEDGTVTISRSAAKITLPCSFMLVAAMNPCPCGYLGDPRRECRCNPIQVQRYRSRISGPLLDRIDIHVEAPSLTIDEMRNTQPAESSQSMRERVEAARAVQLERFRASQTFSNARMSHRAIRQHCALSKDLGDILQQAMEELDLSARAYDRILKVARTIADLANAPDIAAEHLLEAIQFRSLDRNVFY